MPKIKIWHNPRCSKSRQGMEYLNEQNCDLEIMEYMKVEIEPDELADVIKMSDQPLQDFIRSNEPEYAELGLKDKNLTIEEFAQIAAKHPRLLQRPIIIKDGKAVVARPISKIDELL
ncbi:arsenate reductase (glutaredoxin) [candidate division KSB1 bacterium]|nr:arsenate reductase (glutaredoxin) [candidate division KSB1 bacterium]